jgi:serine/threonine protein kinase
MEHYLEGKMPLSEDSAVFYLKQLINGFRGLHDVGVMHRDFKLANILIHN